ncbi:MAG: hypothetical protein ACRC62_31375 [Microcoleus sp.]
MTNDGNQPAEPPKSKDLKNLDSKNLDSKNLDGMAKAFIVNFAWSYAEALERSKSSKNQQEPAPESPPESQVKKADSSPESDR